MSDGDISAHLLDILVCMGLPAYLVNAAALNRLRLAVKIGIEEERSRCVIEAASSLERIRRPNV